MIQDKVIVTCRTIDGPMYYCKEFDCMTEDRSEASRLHPEVAEVVIAALNSHREECMTGEAWDNSYHQVKAVKP